MKTVDFDGVTTVTVGSEDCRDFNRNSANAFIATVPESVLYDLGASACGDGLGLFILSEIVAWLEKRTLGWELLRLR